MREKGTIVNLNARYKRIIEDSMRLEAALSTQDPRKYHGRLKKRSYAALVRRALVSHHALLRKDAEKWGILEAILGLAERAEWGRKSGKRSFVPDEPSSLQALRRSPESGIPTADGVWEPDP